MRMIVRSCVLRSAASEPHENIVHSFAGMSAKEIEEAETERKAKADKLMQEFLQARRKERAGKP